MSGLHFDVTGDNSNFLKKMEEARNGVRSTAKQIEKSGMSVEEYFKNAASGASLAGKAFENDFKKKIYESSQSVNVLTEKIIEQRTEIKKTEAEVKRLGETYRTALKNDPLSAPRKFDEYTSAKSTLDKEKAALFGLTQEQATARLSVSKLRQEYSLYKDDSNNFISANDNIIGSMKEFILTIAGADAIKDFISNVISTAGNFQKMEAVLTNSLGSISKAKETMDMLADFGAKTPFQVDELTSAYVKLANQGFTPTMAQMSKLGDLASSTGKSFDQLTEAIIDAQVGENERLKEFGIRASKSGDTITYTFKEQETTVKNTASAIREYILSLGDLEGVTGANEKISATFIGRLSNIEDELTNQFKNFGEKFNSELSNGINSAAVLVENLNKIIPVIGGLVAAYGAYKSAVLLVTAAHKAGALYENIRLIGMMRKELGLATAAQQAFNTASKANIYAALLSVLIGIGTAVYMFTKRTNEATEANNSLNKVSKNASEEYAKQAANIDKLNGFLKSETASLTLKRDKLKELKGIIPGYNAELNEEGKLINNNTEAIKAYLTQLEKQIKLKAAQEELEELYRKKRLQEKEIKVKEKNAEREKENVPDVVYGGDLGIEAQRNALSRAADAENALKQANAELKITEKNIGEIQNEIEKTSISTSDDKKSEIQNKKYWETKKTEAETARDALDVSMKNSKEWNKYTKQIQEAQVQIDKYSSSSKQESAAEKLREQQEKHNLLLDKQKREQERMQIDTQHELNQIEINGLAEGSEKVLRQRELNHRKELEAIKREAQDKKLKAIEDARSAFEANPDNKKKSFNSEEFIKSEPVKKQFAIFDNVAEAKTKTENTKYNRGDDLKGLLDEYRDYTDKRLAIEQKFNADLAVLEEQRKAALISGDTKQVEQIDRAKAQVTKNRGMELMGLDYDKLKESPEYVRAFENLKETSSDTLNSLLAQFENAKQTAAQVLSPDQLREYTTTIQEIMDELDSRNPFQALADRKKELAEAEKELAEAKRNLDTVNSGGKVANGMKYNEKTGKMDTIYLSGAQALEKYNKAQDKVTKSGAKVQKAEKDVEDVVGELSAAMKELGSTIGGQAGEIITLIGDIGAFAMASMSGIDIVSKKTTTAIQAVEKASVILAIISAAFQIAMKIASLFNNDEEYQKEIERLQGRIEQLQWELDNADAIRLQNNTFQALQKVKEVYAETTDEVLKLHSANDKYANGIYKMASKVIYNNEIMRKSAEKLATAYANIDYTADKALGTEKYSSAKEELKNIAQQQLLIQEQIRNEDAKKKTDHGKIQDWERQIQELGEKANSIINEIVEGIIGGSASDIATELGDAFIEAFQNGENAAEAWGDKVKDIVANVLKRMLVSKYLEEPLGEIFDKYKSKWYKDGEFAGIDAIMESMGGFANDLNAVGSEFQTIWDALPDNIKNMFTPDDKSTSQSSTKGAFETMSQDTGNELNGRFTALQVSNEEIKNSMLAMLTGVNLISTTTANNGITLMEIRNLAISSNSHLEDISKHTKTLMDVGSKLDKIEKNTSKL